MKDILEIEAVCKNFSGVKAVNNCSFEVVKNSITGLIGPNGAGKTTVFNIISGLLTADSGSIYYHDKEINKLSAYKRAQQGFGRSYQSIRLFDELTVLENLVLAFKNNQGNFWHTFSNFRPHQKSLEKKALKFLEEVGLEEKSNLKAYELSYGQKKLLEILRIHAQDSDLILLDEPTAGINPTLIKDIATQIKNFKKAGKTIFIVEHNMPFIMDICDTIIVMDQGTVIAKGKPKEIQKNPEVLEAYLGKPC